MKVDYISEEYQYIAQQRCTCGGTYKAIMQEAIEFLGPHDRLTAQCEKCLSQRQYWFTLSKAYNKRMDDIVKKFSERVY